MPATAAMDNETLDHLLSVVDDSRNLRGIGPLSKSAARPPLRAAKRRDGTYRRPTREVNMRFACRTIVSAIGVVALSLLSAAEVPAQDFPSRVVRIVVAFPAGGPTDFVARLLADKLKVLL